MLTRPMNPGTLSVGLLTVGFLFGFFLRTELPERPAREPDRPAENLFLLVGHLQTRGLRIYPVAAPCDPDLVGPVYLADHAGETWERCRNLRCQPVRAAEWQGIVCVQSIGLKRRGVDDAYAAQGWGENGRQIAGFTFFGDKQLLDRIEAAF